MHFALHFGYKCTTSTFSSDLSAVLHFFQQMAIPLHFSNSLLATHSEIKVMMVLVDSKII